MIQVGKVHYERWVKKITSQIILRKFSDLLLSSINKEEELATASTKNISLKELASLQYLGGYVLRNLFKKYRNSRNFKKEEYQQAMALLKAGKTEKTNTNAELVNALSRGGLWQVTNPIENILIIVEKRFCIETSKQNLQKIQVDSLVQKLMEFSYVQDYFKLVMEAAEIDISKEVAKNVLFGILILYVRIRVFSYAKDVVQKHKIKMKNKGKQAALRKNLKRMDREKLED